MTRALRRHRRHRWMYHPSYRDTHKRAWVKRYMTRWGLGPRPWMLTGVG
jgi:hypothetical protein